MKTKVYKDIANYRATIAGLTYRQVGSILAIIIVSLIVILTCNHVLFIYDNGTIVKINLIFITPIGFYGFFEYEDNNFETLIKNAVKYILKMRLTYNGE